MASRPAIDLALDLARMPALARTPVAPPIPADVADLMRIAAANPQACQAAAVRTGEKVPVLIDAARFYLQQVLFRPDADSYRVLGLAPAASRAIARHHMRWLLQWLHPDRNSGVDAVYAERVLRAWHEISAAEAAPAPVRPMRSSSSHRRRRHDGALHRSPSRHPRQRRPAPLRRSSRIALMWAVPAGLVLVFGALWSVLYYFGPDQIAAMTSFQ